MRKQVRGTSRGLDIILDEEEDADQEGEQTTQTNKRMNIEDRYNTLNIDKDGSICFFQPNPDDSDNEILEKNSVNSSIEFKDRTKQPKDQLDINQITSLS